MMNPECHFGDHDFLRNGHCKWCNDFNGDWLQWQRYEKADREGRTHFDHFHLTVEAKEKCRRGPSKEWLEMIDDGGALV